MASERILLVQLADIGDLVLTMPAIAALREALPQARIDLFASAHALPLVPLGLIDRMIAFRGGKNASRAFFRPANARKLARLRAANYDTVVFFHHFTTRAGVIKFRLIVKATGATRSIGLQNSNAGFLSDAIPDAGFGAKHQAQYWLDLVALLGARNSPRPARLRRESFSVPALSDPRQLKVVLHAGSGGYSKARRWSPERFALLALRLKAWRDVAIILVGQAEDDGHALRQRLADDCVDLLGKTTLPQLADVIAQADLFIGADSGVMHIAAASGTPVISVFGPSNADAWGPWAIGGKSLVLRSAVECSPCSYVRHEIGAREGCAARTCMKLVTVDQVFESARQMLENSAADSGTSVTASAPSHDERLKLLGVPVDAITYKSWMSRIDSWIGSEGAARHVCTVNPEFIMIAQGDSIFYNILNRAALCVPDGVGLIWASRKLGAPLPERVTGSDGVPHIAAAAAQRGWSIFFLGAAEGIAARAATVLQERYSGLQVAGAYSGSPAAADEDHIVQLINQSGADILFVAYGAPQQDKWIARNLPRLRVSMAMGIGGSLDFIAGVVPRAPRWMQQRGLEWSFRLLRQPWRLRRMLRLPRFVIAVLRQAKRQHSG